MGVASDSQLVGWSSLYLNAHSIGIVEDDL